MIKFKHTDVCGWQHAIRGMRNPMNSWDKSDSLFDWDKMCIGHNDLDLMHRLNKAGRDHRKFMRMIIVWVDIDAPLYWWKEFDTYKVGTVANSCSTMHKIHAKEFTLDDFSHEHLGKLYIEDGDKCCDDYPFVYNLIGTIRDLNIARMMYRQTGDKKYWWQMIQLLPTSYNQKRTVMLNYEVLANIYHSRKNHKLDEWRGFCDWIKDLPFSDLITADDKNTDWVKVSDRLPNYGQDVLVCTKDGEVEQAWWSQSNSWCVDDMVLDLDDVTHWMPLPTAPEV